jgi:hypothetical protein
MDKERQKKMSERICKANGCTKDHHNCYAYVDENGALVLVEKTSVTPVKMSDFPGTPGYLLSDCVGKIDPCYGRCCGKAVKQSPETSRWFITMGHPGYNSLTNNRDGYSTKLSALTSMRAYGRRK